MMHEIHGRIDETLKEIQKSCMVADIDLIRSLKLFTEQWEFELKKEALTAMKREINSDCNREALLCHLTRIEDLVNEE